VLDDAAWAHEPMPLDPWVSYNPLRGEPASQRTNVWITYDDQAIYFAFRCFDEQPDKIRTTITRRDNMGNDDWVAISLDSTRAGQTAYHLFVNPSGIQMDALNTGRNEDMAPDFVWQSAGHVDDQGYVVEMRIPLQTIRFRGGDDVKMGVLFMRHNSRMGRVVVVARYAAGAVGLRVACATRLRRAASAARARGNTEHYRVAQSDARCDELVVVGHVERGHRRKREVRHHFDRHARSDRQP
jgi:hypothetical protein